MVIFPDESNSHSPHAILKPATDSAAVGSAELCVLFRLKVVSAHYEAFTSTLTDSVGAALINVNSRTPFFSPAVVLSGSMAVGSSMVR